MSRLRRAVHFVPGANEKMLQKSLALPADSLVLDLEDAVTPENKDSARETVTHWLKQVNFGRQERMVRMNPLNTPWGVRDLEVTMQGRPDSYLVPKVRIKDDLFRIDTILSRMEREYGYPPGGVKLVVIATETPQGLLNIRDFGSCPRVDALSWGAEDLSAAIGARRNRDEQGQFLEVEGAWMGFTGKITIHPSQIAVVNEIFSPSPEDIAESKELLAAFEENRKAGKMAFSFKGQMVDVPHLTRARTILERARQAGLV